MFFYIYSVIYFIKFVNDVCWGDIVEIGVG